MGLSWGLSAGRQKGDLLNEVGLGYVMQVTLLPVADRYASTVGTGLGTWVLRVCFLREWSESQHLLRTSALFSLGVEAGQGRPAWSTE